MMNSHLKTVVPLWLDLRVAFAALFVLTACSSGGGGIPDAGSSQPLDEAVRLATIEASYAVYQANVNNPKADRDAALVAFFRQQSTIEAAGISSTDNVWARFTDGTLYYGFDNAGAPPAVPARPMMADAAARPPVLHDLPGGLKAISASSLEPHWYDISGEVGGWLADAGYAARTGGLTVADLESMSDVSVLFWQTHSGEGELRPDAGPPPADGGLPTDFVFLTSTVATVQLSQTTYKDYRDNGYLAVGTAYMPAGPEPRYAITQKFIREKLQGKFTPAALVAIDSCTGAAADAAWDAAGAAQFVSWSDLSGNVAWVAFQQYFDRLLGANAAPPVSTPKERPFSESAVETWMQRGQLDHDRSVFPPEHPGDPQNASTAQLRFLHHPAHGDFAILRPTIYRVFNAQPDPSRPFYAFTVDGTFGDDPGSANRTVSIGATPLDVVSWNPTEVVVKVPSPIPSGKIQVAIGARKSEAVPITEWHIPFTYAFVGQETLNYQLTMNCLVRADIRGGRLFPEDPLVPMSTATWSLEDSGGSLSVGGDLHDSSGNLLESWSGGGSLPWYDPAVKPLTNFVACEGAFMPPSTLGLVLIGVGDFSAGPGGQRFATFDGIAPLTTIAVDPKTLAIAGDTILVTPGANHGVSATFSWQSVTPTNAPVDDDAR